MTGTVNRGMEATAVNIPSAKTSASENVNARAFAAGTGVTAALVTAAIVVFASIAAYVGFNGMPFGGGDSADSTVSLRSGAPQAAALAAGSTAAAVADDPARPSAPRVAESRRRPAPGQPSPSGTGPGGAATRQPDDGRRGACLRPGCRRPH